jgi:uncharacterized membrane protein
VVHDPSYHQDTARLEAFSDGVFAIAITLLIIEIGVPHLEGDEGLAHALRGLWPSYFGYALSFMTVGIMWTNHHGMFKDIDRVDHTMIVLNILLLLCVSFTPFPTAVLAEFMRDDDNALTATLAYGGAFTLTAIVFNAMWWHASRHRLLIDEHVSDARPRPHAPIPAGSRALCRRAAPGVRQHVGSARRLGAARRALHGAIERLSV